MPSISAGERIAAAPHLAPALAAACVVVSMLLPRATPLAIALLLAAILAAANGRAVAGAWRGRSPVIAAGGLMLAWCLLSLAWSADPFETLTKTALLAAYAGGVVLAGHALQEVHPSQFRPIAQAVLIAFAIGAAYVLIEEATDHSLKTLLFKLVPSWKPSAKHLYEDADGANFTVSEYISNRNVAMLVLLAWPMALIIRTSLAPGPRLLAGIASACVIALSAGMSAHQSSMLAIAVGALIFLIALRLPAVALVAVAAGWLIATAAVVPISIYAFRSAEMHSAKWLPYSARHRFVLWAYTAEQVASRPLTGIGAAATKRVDARRGKDVETVPGTDFEWRSKPHAHNIYLQVWYELGAVGAAIFAALGLAIIAAISRLPRPLLPYPLAAMATASVLGASTWGLWQPWFLAAFAVAAVMSMMALRLAAPPADVSA